MRFEDTVALNRQTLSRRLGQLGLTQSALAEDIGVSRLTVGRWLSGRVERISRSNLERLSQRLACSVEELTEVDTHGRGPRQEDREQAARMIVSREVLDLFTASGQIAKYEQLLRAVAHPSIDYQELLDLYVMLTFVAAKRGDMPRTRRYARLKQRFAEQCGDIEMQLEARMNLAVSEAVLGRLRPAREQLHGLLAMAESLNAAEVLPVALINLILINRVLAFPRRAAIHSVHVLHVLASLPLHSFDLGAAYSNISRLLLESGRLSEAREFLNAARPLLQQRLTPHELAELELYSVALNCLAAKTDVPDAEILRLNELMLVAPQVNAGSLFWAALILRRQGSFAAAGRLIESMLGSGATGETDRAFLLREQARLFVAMRQPELALEAIEASNSAFARLGISGRIDADPGTEADGVFVLPVAMVGRLTRLLPPASC